MSRVLGFQADLIPLSIQKRPLQQLPPSPLIGRYSDAFLKRWDPVMGFGRFPDGANGAADLPPSPTPSEVVLLSLSVCFRPRFSVAICVSHQLSQEAAYLQRKDEETKRVSSLSLSLSLSPYWANMLW